MPKPTEFGKKTKGISGIKTKITSTPLHIIKHKKINNLHYYNKIVYDVNFKIFTINAI
jgi:hypothetical protein